jgi:hypothetical protein
MSIPLDNLYHFVQSQLTEPATLYLFYPHGSKKITDITMLQPYEVSQINLAPRVICHDQEPLNFDYYTDDSPDMQILRQDINNQFCNDIGLDEFLYIDNLNLAMGTVKQGISIYDKTVLLHSELNSDQVSKYQAAGFECAYYWSHAILARDWYRFAQHDQRLDVRNMQNLFLIYARGWTGSREYRLKFIQDLVHAGMMSHCQISMLKQDEGIKIENYKVRNSNFIVGDTTIFDTVPECTYPASSSADYSVSDIQSTLCSVVLETEFDSTRVHLTEKILRPLACGHPFILAAGPGALSVLRSYGFKTFSGLIDESYDQETNSLRRLERICEAMQKIKNLTALELRTWFVNAQEIANYNRQHFFSGKFFDHVVSELNENINSAASRAKLSRGQNWKANRQALRKFRPNNWRQQLYRDHERSKAGHLRKLRLLLATYVDKKGL